MNMTDRKVVIVTGASRGIGKAIAVRLAEDGFAVIVGYAGAKDLADAVVSEIKNADGEAHAVQADIGVREDAERLFAETFEKYGRLDAVVNNAGILDMISITEGVKAENIDVFDRTIATNLRGTFLMMGLAAQHLREGGRIVTLSTSAIAPAFPNYGPYVASKAGSEALMKVMANELRGRKITVNAVAPGPVATELFMKGKPPELVEKMSKLPPLERLGEPEDISPVVSFLLSDGGGWVNGQVLRANGGYA